MPPIAQAGSPPMGRYERKSAIPIVSFFHAGSKHLQDKIQMAANPYRALEQDYTKIISFLFFIRISLGIEISIFVHLLGAGGGGALADAYAPAAS